MSTTKARIPAHRPAGDPPAAHRPAAQGRPLLLPLALVGLASALAAVALLGPLVTGVIDYRYSETMLNQARGLDAVALGVVVPAALVAAALTRRGHRAGAVLALGPAFFALYMTVQYVIGPEYLTVPGNGERAFPLFIAVFVLAGIAAAQAWTTAVVPSCVGRRARRRATVLIALAAFVIGGMYLANGFLAATSDFPSFVAERAGTSEYDEHPTAYWIVAFLDLAVVVPLTLAAAVGLLRGRPWASRAYYGVIGWYALVPLSVAAMAVTMVARDDPAADTGKAVVFCIAAAVFLGLAARAFTPCFTRPTRRSDT